MAKFTFDDLSKYYGKRLYDDFGEENGVSMSDKMIYNLGWVSYYDGTLKSKVYWHHGTNLANSSDVWLIPGRGLYVVITQNWYDTTDDKYENNKSVFKEVMDYVKQK